MQKNSSAFACIPKPSVFGTVLIHTRWKNPIAAAIHEILTAGA
jgi:hypothetical protein